MKLAFLRKPDAEPMQGVKSYRAIALTSVMSNFYATCVILRLEKEEETEELMQLQGSGNGGISYQYLQVLMTQLLQKHWKWREDRRKDEHGHQDV